MGEMPPSPTDYQPTRELYKAALDYLTAESEDIWSRFSGMLVAHTIFVAVAANLLFGDRRTPIPGIVPFVLLLAGLVVCFAWWAAVERGFKYQQRYVKFAKRLEAGFPETHRLLTDGANTKMTFPSGLRTRHAARLVIFVFFVLYLAALAQLLLPYLVH